MELLKGFRLLDLSRLLPGAYCSLLLADLGMEVLKVEDTEEGDYLRKIGRIGKRENAFFLSLNRNKKSMTLNLKTQEGKEIFYRLIKTHDIVLEGFRPGVMDRLGVGFEELRKRNPRVILCSLSGYGQDGPYRERSGHDINYIGLAGILDLTGKRNGSPAVPGVQIADLGGGGMTSAIAILAAIIHRERTGQGQLLDISMLDGVLSWLSIHAAKYFVDQDLPKKGEMLLNGGYACYQVYSTKDGRYMSLGALEPKFWKNFCEAVGRSDLVYSQFTQGEEQLRVIENLRDLFEKKTQREWVDFFKDLDACCEPVSNFEEVFRHPQVLHRRMVKEITDPVEGKIRQIGNPIKSSLPSSDADTPPPLQGEHTTEVLTAAGYSEEEIRHFKEVRAI